MATGRVRSYNPATGFGMIAMKEGADVILRRSALQEGAVEPGEEVLFDIVEEGDRRVAAHVVKVSRGGPGRNDGGTAPSSPADHGAGKAASGSSRVDHLRDAGASVNLSLPKFDVDPVFARLRAMMRATKDGTFAPEPVRPLSPLPQDHASAEEVAKLSGKGLDVTEGEIRLLADGTLAFKNRRVVLYIRTPNDPSVFGGLDFDEGYRASRSSQVADESGPRFHVANCRTLEKMRQIGRARRYVVSVRDDGLFEIVTPGGMVTSRSLKVCKNCLERLNWQGFLQVAGYDRDLRVNAFLLKDFFAHYGRNI